MHGLFENDQMFSVGVRPWHGLGTVLTEAPSIKEGIKIAKLDWDVELQELTASCGTVLKDKRAVIRKDNNDCIGIVSPNYQILQNKEAFNWFEPFIENNMATLETAGSLFNGRKVFILAKINSDDMVIDEKTNDRVEKYILLSNSHDGSQSLRVGYTPIRVVCNNTLSAAESSNQSQLIRLNHSKSNMVQTLEQLRETMDLVNQQFIATEEMYKDLAKKQVNKLDLHRYVKQVFSVKSLENIITEYDKKQEEQQKIEETRKRLLARVEEIFDLEPVHNAWTMYNSVNYYLNHQRSKNLDNRYASIWFGDSKRIDNKALKLAQYI